VSDPGSVPDSQHIQVVLRTIELHENAQDRCGSEAVAVETSLDQSVVDAVLGHLWQEDRIECRSAGWTGYYPIRLTDIRRVIPGRERLWGDEGRYKGYSQIRYRET